MKKSGSKLSDHVISEILDMITVQKRFVAGDKLPNERELSAELGVSRTTLRQAILYLVTQNVLEIHRGRGTFVTNDNDQLNEDYGFNELEYTHLKLRDLYEMRLMFEPHVAYYAAKRATDSELQNIIKLGEDLEGKMKIQDECCEDNMYFHNEIAKATHNEFVIKLMQIINAAVIRAFKESKIKQTLYDDVKLDHIMILEYLKKRDAEGVRQAMHLHIMHSIKDYNLD